MNGSLRKNTFLQTKILGVSHQIFKKYYKKLYFCSFPSIFRDYLPLFIAKSWVFSQASIHLASILHIMGCWYGGAGIGRAGMLVWGAGMGLWCGVLLGALVLGALVWGPW